MSKGLIGFVGGLAAGAVLTMAYLHRDVITAAIKGEELPEAPEGCPFAAKDEIAVEEPVEAVKETVEEAVEKVAEVPAAAAEAAKEVVEEATEKAAEAE